jgi:hypothetical protein
MRYARSVLLALVAAVVVLGTAVVGQSFGGVSSLDGYLNWTRLNPQRNFIASAHAAPKDVYVNDVGAASATSRSFPFPDGTVLVKEISDTDTLTVTVLAAMRKVAGFDTANGDWQYAMLERQADGTFMGDWVGSDHGMHAMCVGCHTGAASSDYAFLNYTGP